MTYEPRQNGGLAPRQRIRIVAGTFENFEAIVESIDQSTGKVHAGINVFGCVTPVEVAIEDCQVLD
jgi:transcription antitermination factor NusG